MSVGDDVIFTKWIDITPGNLDEWVPDPVVNRYRVPRRVLFTKGFDVTRGKLPKRRPQPPTVSPTGDT